MNTHCLICGKKFKSYKKRNGVYCAKYCGVACLKTSYGDASVKSPYYRIYRIWYGMKQRCENPSDKSFMSYGGRGITIYDKWTLYDNFKEWAIKNGYSKDLSIDRINNDAGYSPDNCRWADRKTQQNNTRSSVFLTYYGRRMTLKQWSEKLGIKYNTLCMRLNKLGWPVDKVLATPLRSSIVK